MAAEYISLVYIIETDTGYCHLDTFRNYPCGDTHETGDQFVKDTMNSKTSVLCIMRVYLRYKSIDLDAIWLYSHIDTFRGNYK